MFCKIYLVNIISEKIYFDKKLSFYLIFFAVKVNLVYIYYIVTLSVIDLSKTTFYCALMQPLFAICY